MKHKKRLIAGLATLGLSLSMAAGISTVTASPAEAATPPGQGVFASVYYNSDCKGAYYTRGGDVWSFGLATSTGIKFNQVGAAGPNGPGSNGLGRLVHNQAASVWVPRYTYVTMYENSGFKGRSQTMNRFWSSTGACFNLNSALKNNNASMVQVH